MAYPGSFPTARVDVSHLRNRRSAPRAASSTPINSQPAGYMSEEDRIKRAKFDRKLATVNAGTAQMENTSKGYSEAPDSEIWKKGGNGNGARRSKDGPAVSKTMDATQKPRKLFDTLGSSPPSGAPAIPARRPTQVLTADDGGDGPLMAPEMNDANPAAPTAAPQVNDKAFNQNSSKSSKGLRDGFKKAAGESRGANQSRIMQKGEKFQDGKFKGMTREEARKKYRLQFNSASL